MRATILGAGGAGLLHGLSLRAFGVEIDRVYDPDPTKAAALSAILGARPVSHEDPGDSDVVSICSPPCFHVAQAEAFAEEGRLVLVEKPIALDDAELQRLVGLPRCVPVLQWRFGRALRAIRRAIAAGELGACPSVSIDLAWQRDATYFAARADWGCGLLLSVGIHPLDAVLFALGGSVRQASGSERSAGSRDDAQAVAWFVTDSGAQIALRLTAFAAHDRTRLSFCGAGVTADIVGSEADPTASSVAWSCADTAKLRRLHVLESEAGGSASGPLVVPLVAAALRGDAETPDVGGAASAHRAIFAVTRAPACTRV